MMHVRACNAFTCAGDSLEDESLTKLELGDLDLTTEEIDFGEVDGESLVRIS